MDASAARAKEIFLDALEAPEEERTGRVARACAGDSALLSRVRSLLAAHREPPRLLRRGLSGAPTPPVASGARALARGERLGPYVLERALGEGGFGTVWEALQETPVRRRVALKLLKSGVASPEVLGRFEAEREVLARMQHPSIAMILDAGAADGLPYIALELVEGAPITAWARARGLRTQARLRAFLGVCRAVQHAHQKGVLHRDLKPGNVLVSESGGAPLPKVIDFGIAKLLDPDAGADAVRTRTGLVMGTPAYVSPEQLDGPGQADTRSDVYSLGALLYELLCDQTPIDHETLRGAGITELQRLIREVDPPPPSRRLARARAPDAGARAAMSARAREVRGELDWITLRCLEKDPARRYQSVAELAADLERHLRHEPVLAGPPGPGYRLAKLARRHRAAVVAAAAVLLALASATAVSAGQALQARRELSKFEEIARFLEDVLVGVDPAYARGQDTALLQAILDRAAARIEGTRDPLVEAPLRRTLGQAYASLALHKDAARELGRALELHEHHLGPLHPDTLTVQNDLGSMWIELGDPDRAGPLLRAAHAGRLRVLGEDHRDTQVSLNNVALLLRTRGDLAGAEALFREVEAARARRLGPDHEDVVTAVNNLAGVLDEQGRSEEALALYERALGVQERARGELHPLTLAALNNLGFAYQKAGRLAEAEPLFRRAIDVKRRVLAPDHPSVLIGLNNHASLCRELGRDEEAEACWREALPLALARLGPTDARTLVLQLNFGRFLLSRERAGEALPLLEAAAGGLASLHGPDDGRARKALEGLEQARTALAGGGGSTHGASAVGATGEEPGDQGKGRGGADPRGPAADDHL